MPSDTEDQARFMAACAHGAGYESCPPDKVSYEFNQADKGTAMLSNAMKHRIKRPMGGPVTTGGQSPNIQALLQALSSQLPPVSAPWGNNPHGPQFNLSQLAGPNQGPNSAVPPPPPQSGGIPLGGMQPPGRLLPPPPPALSPLGAMRPNPGMMRRPMPMSYPGGGIRPPVNPGMMRARGGGIAPPGLAPQSPLPPPSPLSSLIGGGMAAMHGGPGLAPHMRQPRIPLPGALRNINQTINHARGRLGKLGPV
jgi:hypothetical protein